MKPETRNSENEKSNEPQYIVPRNHKLLIACLSQFRDEINEALLHRPAPKGDPYSNLSEAMDYPIDAIQSALLGIEGALNGLTSLYDCRSVNISDDISEQSKNAEEIVRKWIEIYHRIWERPFPEGMETHQTLASAIPERVLRDVLTYFEQLIKISSDPDQAVMEYGSTSITLPVTIDISLEVDQLVSYQKQFLTDGQSEILTMSESPVILPKMPILGFTLLAISLLFIVSMFAAGEILIGFLALLVLLALLLSGK